MGSKYPRNINYDFDNEITATVTQPIHLQNRDRLTHAMFPTFYK